MKMYTAQKMRVRAAYLEGALADAKTAAMLRQAADMMEREATREKSSQVGDAAAIREALEALVGVIDNYDSKNTLWWHSGAKGVKPLKDARAALPSPPRNCDVGTAEEQAKRFKSFCKTHLSGIRSICSPKCPCVCCRSMFHCLTKWAQMPYEEASE